MNPIFCYGTDRGNWGQTIVSLAKARGHTAQIFTECFQVPAVHSYVFMRVPQFPPGLDKGIRDYGELHARHDALDVHPRHTMIIDADTVRMYEDKAAQAEAYPEWMPETMVNRTDDEGFPATDLHDFLEDGLQTLGLPLISKASFGSASANVRLIQTRQDALRDLMQAFHSEGIPARRGGAARQQGHVIWQQFLPGNDYDYRACINGQYVCLLRRYNRNDRPMASGSGNHEPVTELNGETTAVLEKSFEFFRRNGIKWGGIDLVFDGNAGIGLSETRVERLREEADLWKILETTLGWSQSAYKHCRYFGANFTPTKYEGHQIFDLLLDQLEWGVWDL